MPPGVRVPEDEVEMILKAHREGSSYHEISVMLARPERTVYHIIRKFSSTTESAQAYLKASAMKLAKKIVKHSTVSEAMDVLSRPNVGVLHPNRASNEGSQILISIGQDSLGAIASGQKSHLGLPATPSSGTIGSHEALAAPQARAHDREAGPEAPLGVTGPQTVPSKPSPGYSTPSKGSARRSRDTGKPPRPRREALKAVPAPFGDPPSREAIKGRVPTKDGRAGNTGINLRYDIVEPDDGAA